MYKAEIFACIYMFLIAENVNKRFISRTVNNSIIKTLESKIERLQNCIRDLNQKEIETNNIHATNQTRLDAFVKEDMKRSNFSTELGTLINTCEKMLDHGNDWYESEAARFKIEDDFFQGKLKKIEQIMIDGVYNDPEYLAFDGKEWPMKRLVKKAKEMKIELYNF